jgi:hypothetical protein
LIAVEIVPASGTAPVDQFVPVIQSELVAPVHTACAAADRGNKADNAAIETLISSRR